MQKLSAQSKDLSQENIKKIEEIFPNCVTETYDQDGNLVRSIDFDILRQDLSDHVVEGPKERYQFNWPGKREAILLANAPTTNTLRPLPEKSVDFENTKNVYIEGDNLEALKILRETYMGKIKMIYIDPPYNTGNDFVYKDNFKQSTEDYLKSSGDIDEEGNRMEVNGESNGRFHSDWLNMMYPRLVLARDLLMDEGLIFISIDDNEQNRLKTLCDEIFGESNFISCFSWMRTATASNLSKTVRSKIEYILLYSKGQYSSVLYGGLTDGGDVPLINGGNKFYVATFPKESLILNIPDGVYKAGTYDNVELVEDLHVQDKRALNDLKLGGKFKWKQETINEEIGKGTQFIVKSEKFSIRFQRTQKSIKTPSNLLTKTECNVGTNEEGCKEIQELFGNCIFNYSKPVSLLSYLTNMVHSNEGIFMDFFSGSATFADSILRLNANDLGKRRFILVQLPEKLSEATMSAEESFKTICDIGEERIRRVGTKIRESNPLTFQDLDAGFRVFKIDSSNMKDMLSTPKETQLSLLENAESAIKPDRISLDLVTQVMLQLGITLDADIKIGKFVGGGQFYAVNGNDLVCCFDKNISESSIKEMAKLQPLNVAFRDDSFANDQDEVNCEQIFKTLSPITGKNIFVL